MVYHGLVGDGLRLDEASLAGGGVTVQTPAPTPMPGGQQEVPGKNKGQDLLRLLQSGKQARPVAQQEQCTEAQAHGETHYTPQGTNSVSNPWQTPGSLAKPRNVWGSPGTGLGNGLGNGLLGGNAWGEYAPGLTGVPSIWGPGGQAPVAGSTWGTTPSNGSVIGAGSTDGSLEATRLHSAALETAENNTPPPAQQLAPMQQQLQQMQHHQLQQQLWHTQAMAEPLVPRHQQAAPHTADWQQQPPPGWPQDLLPMQREQLLNAGPGGLLAGPRLSAGGVGAPAQQVSAFNLQQQLAAGLASHPLHQQQHQHQQQQQQQQVEQAAAENALAQIFAQMSMNPQQHQQQQLRHQDLGAAEMAVRLQQQGGLGVMAARGAPNGMPGQYRGPGPVQLPGPMPPLHRAPGRPGIGAPPGMMRGRTRPWDARIFESQLQSLAASLMPSQAEQVALAQAVDGVERLLRRDFPQGVVKLYGSAANGLCITRTNDIDVCLDLGAAFDMDAAKAEVVTHLGRLFTDAGMENIVTLPRARVPVVKFVYPPTKTSVDITVNNLLPLENTRLLATYAATDSRLRALVLLVKHWAKTRGVNDTYRGTLSSYAYVLMCIGLLQQRNPPILPKLQQMQPRQQRSIAGWDVSFCDNVEQLKGFGAANTESLCDLVDAFFSYFGTQHDYNNSVLSIRTGGLISKRSKDWVRRQDRDRHLVCIEDPFELSHDLGRCVDWQSVRTLRGEFERAAHIIATEPEPLRWLLQPAAK